ncbi:MAG: oligosaccharide flippase family protein [Novosphingobium sp.]
MERGALASMLIVAARGWTQVAAVALLLVAGRYLDVTSFGEFAVASALTVMLSQWVGVGCYERVLSVHGEERAADTGFVINSLSSLVMVVLGLGVAVLASYIYQSATITWMTAIMAPLALFAGWRSAGEATLLGKGRMIRFALATLIVETAALAVGAIALIEGKGVFALVAAKYIQFAIGGPAFLLMVGRLPRLLLDRAEASEIARLWRSLIADRVLGYFQNYSADLVLGALLSPAAAGVYRISLRIVSLVNTVIADPLRSLAWTILARTRREGRSTAAIAESMIGLVYVLLSGPLIVLALVGGDLAVAALGERWAQTGPVIALLALASLVLVPSLVSEAAFGVTGTVRELPRQRLVIVGVSLVLMVAAARFGVAWTAASQLLASLVSVAVVVRAQRVHVGMRVSGYAPIAASALAAATAAVAIGAGAEELFGLTGVGPRAALQLGVGMAVYLGLVVLHSGARESLVGFTRLVGVQGAPLERASPADVGPAVAAATG